MSKVTDFFEIPELAIKTFETWSGLHVVVRDIEENKLVPYLPPCYVKHSQPLCAAIKGSQYRIKCHNFEWVFMRNEIIKFPHGRIHVCHAGLLEWIVPVFLDGELALMLFAGQRLAGPDLSDLYYDPAPSSVPLPWKKDTALPTQVSQPEVDLYLEGLRQLGARLRAWLVEAQKLTSGPLHPPKYNDLSTRRNYILRFIHRRHVDALTLDDLAKEFHLSKSRMAHIVKEACGRSFGDLVTEARVRSARGLLRHSSLPISEISAQCGFSDPSRFHRVFKRTTGMTPAVYRRQTGEV